MSISCRTRELRPSNRATRPDRRLSYLSVGCVEVREEQRVRDEPTIDALRKRYVDEMQGANADVRLSQLECSEAAGLAEAAATKRAERAGAATWRAWRRCSLRSS